MKAKEIILSLTMLFLSCLLSATDVSVRLHFQSCKAKRNIIIFVQAAEA
jgi:hypothetical protein